jgi:hypothetical protein
MKQLIKIIEGNQLPNCPVTKDDVMAVEDVFRPSMPGLKGKILRLAPEVV